MRIRSVSFEGHHVLGDLALDFSDPVTGTAATTVILAGENGTGKSLILNEIYRVLGEPDISHQRMAAVSFKLDIDAEEIPLWQQQFDTLRDQPGAWDHSASARLVLHPNASWAPDSTIALEVAAQPASIPLKRAFADPRLFRAFYSEAEISFQAGTVGNIGAGDLDKGPPFRRSKSELAREIAQLIVDIRAADNEDLTKWVEADPGVVPPDEVKEVRLKRFRDAIAYMFPTKRLSSVVRNNGHMRVEFNEFERTSDLETLSTGEKQIVFRGGFLLRDLEIMKGATILVDEPELGLHPAWQARILGFYRRLLPDTGPIPTQFIFTTHSPFVVHDQAQAKVIILKKDSATGAIQVDPEPSYPTTGQARVVNALNIPALVAQAAHDTIVLVEGTTDVSMVELAWEHLRGTPLPFELRAALANSAIRTVLKDDQLFAKNPGKRIVGLFDFDDAYNDWKGIWTNQGQIVSNNVSDGLVKRYPGKDGWAMLLPVPAFRAHLADEALGGDSALTIELLFCDADLIPGMLSYKRLPAAGATVPVVKPAMKTQFAAHARTLAKEAFANFEPLLQRIEDIRAGRL